MLTLTRRPGQEIRIGDNIRILVKEIRGRQVRLGIEAPPGVPIYREEIYQEIVAEMGQAAAPEMEFLESVMGTTAPQPHRGVTVRRPVSSLVGICSSKGKETSDKEKEG